MGRCGDFRTTDVRTGCVPLALAVPQQDQRGGAARGRVGAQRHVFPRGVCVWCQIELQPLWCWFRSLLCYVFATPCLSLDKLGAAARADTGARREPSNPMLPDRVWQGICGKGSLPVRPG